MLENTLNENPLKLEKLKNVANILFNESNISSNLKKVRDANGKKIYENKIDNYTIEVVKTESETQVYVSIN